MLSLPRFCWCAVLVVALLAGVGYGSVRLTHGAGLRDALRTLASESRRRQEITCKQDALQQVLSLKCRITPEIIDGKMPLVQAVAAIRAAYEANPACLPETGLDDYHLAGNVLNWVRSELRARRTMNETVLRRLEAEMRELHDPAACTPGPVESLTQ